MYTDLRVLSLLGAVLPTLAPTVVGQMQTHYATKKRSPYRDQAETSNKGRPKRNTHSTYANTSEAQVNIEEAAPANQRS